MQLQENLIYTLDQICILSVITSVSYDDLYFNIFIVETQGVETVFVDGRSNTNNQTGFKQVQFSTVI